MVIRPCPNTISKSACPCDDPPVQNYSSEAPDGIDYLSRVWYGSDPPPFFRNWNATECGQTVISQISQTDADTQAAAMASQCADDGPCIGCPPGTPGTGPPGFACNDAEQACVPCPDGTQFCYTVHAGTFCGFATVARADSYAHGLAVVLAKEKRFCLSALSASGCVGTAYNQTITATGPVITPCTWTVVAGAMPPGLTFGGFSPNIDTTLGPTETIQGTPTMAGSFTFTVQCQGSDFSFMQKQYTIVVGDVTPHTLPDASQNVAYSQALTAASVLGTPVIWTLISGSLPTGITLSSAGVISGSPPNAGASGFTVQAKGSTGTCTRNYVLTVDAVICDITVAKLHCAAMKAYWLANGGNAAWNGDYNNSGPPFVGLWSSGNFLGAQTDIQFNTGNFNSSFDLAIPGSTSVTYSKLAAVPQVNCYLGTYTLATWNGLGTAPPATIVVTL